MEMAAPLHGLLDRRWQQNSYVHMNIYGYVYLTYLYMESDIINTYINPKAAMLAARAVWVMIWMAPVLLEEQTCSCWGLNPQEQKPPQWNTL